MCLRNCDKVLLLEPTNRNASLCRIKALSHAINIPELELTEDLQQLLSTIERNKQEADGTFDFPSIYRQNLNRKPQRLWDHFEYIGPVTIQQLSNAKGRGLVATSDINAGQLIIAAKALECAFQSDKWSRFESPFDELLQRLINRCLIDFESVKTLLKLYAGPDVDQLSEVIILATKLLH